MYLNIAAYRFTPIASAGLPALREKLLVFSNERELRGTILLSTEGINLFVAGKPPAVEELLIELRALPGLADLEVKRSDSAAQPFNRMLVRIKKEIIAFGIPDIEPGRHTSPKIPPLKLKAWLDEGKPLVLLDTRNDYEVRLGTFKNAQVVDIEHFREFPQAVRQLPPEMKEQPVVMFCTGGIRCEKAGPFMEREGFKNIFQLDGGILKYFEECGREHYDGDCFVFDRRVSVDGELHETDVEQCFVCLEPLSTAEQEDPRYVPEVSCPHCFQTPEQKSQNTLATRHAKLARIMNPLPGAAPYDNLVPVFIKQSCDGMMLLDALTNLVRGLSRAAWEEEFARELVLDMQERIVRPEQIVRAGERYYHKSPLLTEPAVSADIRILHEDASIVVIHKPAPLPMHPGGRFNRNTLRHILDLVYHPDKLKSAHRLDANTTGVAVYARRREIAAHLREQFDRGEVEKIYLARVHGQPPADEFICDAPISAEPGEMGTRQVDFAHGLPSLTKFRVLERLPDGSSLLEARPITGRTNQIRIHLAHLSRPIVGEPVYQVADVKASAQTLDLQAPPLNLHAWRISLMHPKSGERLTFEAPRPAWAVRT